MDMKMLDNICKDICQEVDTCYMKICGASIHIKSFCASEIDQLEDIEKSIEILKKDLKEYMDILLNDMDMWFTINPDGTFYEEIDLHRFFKNITWREDIFYESQCQ